MTDSPRLDALRAVWISDVHLGSRECRASLLLDFLRRTRCDVLYLVGDIIDFESLRRDFYWPPSHTDVLRAILQKSYEGTRVVYVPGNHDDALRAYDGAALGNVELSSETIHTTRAGKTLLVMHGDRFDAIVRGRGLSVWIGAHACRSLLALNRFVHWLHELAGRPYWSLAQHVKNRFGFVQRYVERYRDATLAAAREAGVDGVICGHIHKAEVVEVDGLLYCNDGDWVESCTALVEDEHGTLSLLKWRPAIRTFTTAAHASGWRRPVAVAARLRGVRAFRVRRRRHDARTAGEPGV